MIRSVGVGGSSVSNKQRRTQQKPEVPFPKLGASPDQSLQDVSQDKPLMVGVKPNPRERSILDSPDHYLRLNADGDRLEVSRKAISLAKEKFAFM